MHRRRWMLSTGTLAVLAGGLAWGYGQNAAPAKGAAKDAAQQEPAEAETLEVALVGRIAPSDRDNLQPYLPDVVAATKEKWMGALPPAAEPPESAAGTVKYLCWLHTDGSVTGLVLEQGSGHIALNRAARAAITGSAPYEAFPYGISVQQVRVRFTFAYNGGTAPADQAIPGDKPQPR